jgi:hypothetical protein
MIEHKGFLVGPFQTEPGRWRAKISRSDGRKIRVAVPAGDEHDSITTRGMEALRPMRQSKWPSNSSTVAG